MCKLSIRVFAIHSPSSSPGDGLTVLSAAAQDVAGGCRGSRRASAWYAGCFLSYADTKASSAREDASRTGSTRTTAATARPRCWGPGS
ncbi:cysteine-rich receptor-like protein kinase 15 [Panicum miliaceum]|uniref:Cysteine-rich receptor-like protein kinase 15 n=1 Tax=Panicum miliaceum TaxID=4540 RepID=A0A3L6TXU3_PANMI|nr:cysteine-rich receptor-like protein kinase 15 [Panicum miliaceum]